MPPVNPAPEFRTIGYEGTTQAHVLVAGVTHVIFERDPDHCHRSIVAGLLPGHPVRHPFAEPV